jgi:hypothetical protein
VDGRIAKNLLMKIMILIIIMMITNKCVVIPFILICLVIIGAATYFSFRKDDNDFS